MRTTNLNKIKNIKKSVLNLSQKNGVLSLTTAEIAKHAGVSPATIYLHYHNKIDLLSRLYEEVKINLHDGLGQAIDLNQSLDIQIKQTNQFMVNQYRKYPKEAYFMSNLYTNSELLDDSAKEFSNKKAGPLTDLFKRIKNDDKYTNVSQDILEIFFSVPTLALEQDKHLSKDKLDQISNMLIKAIKK